MKQISEGSEFYVAGVVCWKCGKHTHVYTWHGHTTWSQVCPVEGRPLTVRYVHGERAGKVGRDGRPRLSASYYANICEHCGAVQGDSYLYALGGPFWGWDQESA